MSFAFYERGARGDVPAGRKMIIMRRKVLLWGNTETLKGGSLWTCLSFGACCTYADVSDEIAISDFKLIFR